MQLLSKIDGKLPRDIGKIELLLLIINQINGQQKYFKEKKTIQRIEAVIFSGGLGTSTCQFIMETSVFFFALH